MERKWRWWETMFRSLADEMSSFLKVEKIRYERSGCYGGYHFEIFCNDAEMEKINSWIDGHTITAA